MNVKKRSSDLSALHIWYKSDTKIVLTSFQNSKIFRTVLQQDLEIYNNYILN